MSGGGSHKPQTPPKKRRPSSLSSVVCAAVSMSSQMSQRSVVPARKPLRSKSKRSRGNFEFKGRGGFARAVKRIVHEKVLEKKFAYQIYSDQEMDWSGHRHYLTEIAGGTGENDRIGRHITPQYLAGRVTLQNQITSGGTVSARVGWSILLVHDKQQVGDNYPAVSEVITDTGTEVAPCGMLNSANRGRFKILRRWDGTTDYNAPIQMVNLYHKFPGFVTKYNGSTSGDIEGNGLMLIFISGADPVNNTLLFSGHIRMWFTDA